VGLSTLLGPEVVSTGRLEGLLLTLVLSSSATLLAIVALALLGAAFVQAQVHARWHPGIARSGRATSVGRLAAVELVAIMPIGLVAALSVSTIVGQVRDELLVPGDLAVPLMSRLVARTAIPLAALALAVLVSEALDGTLSRRPLVASRQTRSTGRSLGSVVVTAAVAWGVTLLVLVPGLVFIDATWQAARLAWAQLAAVAPSAGSVSIVSAFAMAIVGSVAMVAAWVGVLLLCGVASLVRAHLWTSRAAASQDWTEAGH
jgi:hypothetical protein